MSADQSPSATLSALFAKNSRLAEGLDALRNVQSADIKFKVGEPDIEEEGEAVSLSLLINAKRKGLPHDGLTVTLDLTGTYAFAATGAAFEAKPANTHAKAASTVADWAKFVTELGSNPGNAATTLEKGRKKTERKKKVPDSKPT